MWKKRGIIVVGALNNRYLVFQNSTCQEGTMMNTQFHADIDQVIEELREELYQKMPCWGRIRTSSELFDFEQELQKTLNTLQAKVVGVVLEEVHRDIDFVTECQKQALHQCEARSKGKREAPVRTLSGKQVRVRTPWAWFPRKLDQERKGERRCRGEGGIYPVFRRLGIVRGTTPRLLAEFSRQMADGPSGAEARERLVDREIVCNQGPIKLRMQDLASIALWQRQEAVANLDQIGAIEPAPLAGKRVVVGLDGGRLRIRINKKGDGGWLALL